MEAELVGPVPVAILARAELLELAERGRSKGGTSARHRRATGDARSETASQEV